MKTFVVIVALLLFSVFAVAQSGTAEFAVSTSDLVWRPAPPTIIFNADAKSVTLHPDGTVTFSEGMTVDEAAKTFWKAVEKIAPCRAVKEEEK